MSTCKRIFASLGIVLVITMMVVTALTMTLRNRRIQTATAQILAAQLSKGLHADVRVGKLDYHFPNHLLVTNVLLRDQQADTLAAIDTLLAHADIVKLFREDTLLIRSIELTGVTANLYSLPSGRMNFAFLQDAFAKEKDTTEAKPFPLNLQIRNIAINRVHARYCDWQGDVAEALLVVRSISKDGVDAEIDKFQASLSNRANPKAQPLCITELKARLVLTDSLLSFPTLHADLPNSCLDVQELYLTRDARHDLAVQVDGATITPADLSVLVPGLRGMRAPWSFSADVRGNLDSLQANSLRLDYRKHSLFRGNATAYGLSAVLDTISGNDTLFYARAQCEDLSLTRGVLQDILSNAVRQPVNLPDVLDRLGNVHYRGELQGRLANLRLLGAFTTALGSIRTDGHAVAADSFREFSYVGSLTTKRFMLGALLGKSELGALAFDVETDGHIAQNHPFHGTVQARVTQNEPGLRYELTGGVNLSQKATPDFHFDLDLHHFRPGDLAMSEKYADMTVGANVCMHMQGVNLDSLRGHFSVSDVSIGRSWDTLRMEEMQLSVEPGSIKLSSDYLNLGVQGQFSLSTLSASIMHMVTELLPSVLPDNVRTKWQQTQPDNQLNFYLYARNMERFSSILELGVSVPDMPTIKGQLNDKKGLMGLQAVVPELYLNGMHVEDVALNLSKDKQAHVSLFGQVHPRSNPSGRHMGDQQVYLTSDIVGDSVSMRLNWSNVDTIHNAGELNLCTHFSRYANRPLITLNIAHSDVLLQDSLWHLNNSQITYCAADTLISIDHFRFGCATQYIHANGIISTHPEDTVRAELRDVDLDYILGALTDVHNSLYFGGRVSGHASAYGILSAPMFDAEVSMVDAQINGSILGDLTASATLDSLNQVAIRGDVYDRRVAGKHVVSVDGLVATDKSGFWQLMIYPDSVEIGLVNYWTSGILSDLSGRASGLVRVWGGKDPETHLPGTWVTVRALAHNVGLTVPFTGCRYYVTDSVVMDSTSLHFRNMHVVDSYGNPIDFDGDIVHDGTWRGLTYQFTAVAHHAEVLNLPANPNDLYYGHVFANGNVRIAGDEHDCTITANATTTDGNFTLSVAGASSAHDDSFITFVSHEEIPHYYSDEESAPKPKPSGKFTLDLGVELTPQVQVQVLMDKHTGDCLKGRGEGNVRLKLVDTDHTDIQMLGNVTLRHGTFGFTFQNVIRREFQIADGSTVTWNGDPENPMIDAKALYRVTASLRDLFGTDASSVTNRSQVPVNCVLNISDRLSNPVIRFGIELPSSDESVASQVRSVINTDEMMMRQVLYLLVFSRFYTPEYVQTSSTTGVNETYSLLSSTLTGQINTWLSRMTDMVSVGFNFRTDGEGADAAQEYEAQFEINPVRGLIINGNFGYRYNDLSNQPIFGNLDVEYMITPNGKLRVKGYTHTVDKYSLRQASTVQGVGFVFKHDFNWPTRKKDK